MDEIAAGGVAAPVLALGPFSIHDRFGHALTSALPIARPGRGMVVGMDRPCETAEDACGPCFTAFDASC
ncbi:hypothetical protein D3C75_1316130 [compost metagenome]